MQRNVALSGGVAKCVCESVWLEMRSVCVGPLGFGFGARVNSRGV